VSTALDLDDAMEMSRTLSKRSVTHKKAIRR